LENLEEAPTELLLRLRENSVARVTALRESFMRLRSGGCAVEALVDQAQAELDAVDAELRSRGESV
jgi:hypothetical protein